MTSTVALKVRTIDMHSNISHSQMFYPENMLFKVQHEVAWLSLRQLGGFLEYTFFTIKQCVDYHQTLIKCVYIPSHWQLLYFYLVSSEILSKYCTWHVFWNYNSIFMLYILKSNLSICCRNLVTRLYEKKTFAVYYILYR